MFACVCAIVIMSNHLVISDRITLRIETKCWISLQKLEVTSVISAEISHRTFRSWTCFRRPTSGSHFARASVTLRGKINRPFHQKSRTFYKLEHFLSRITRSSLFELYYLYLVATMRMMGSPRFSFWKLPSMEPHLQVLILVPDHCQV